MTFIYDHISTDDVKWCYMISVHMYQGFPKFYSCGSQLQFFVDQPVQIFPDVQMKYQLWWAKVEWT